MLNKNRTWALLIILLLVLGLYLVLSYSGDHEKNFRTNLPVVDTAATDHIIISPSESEEPVRLVKTDGKWMVATEDGQFEANKNSVNALMLSLSDASVVSVAATSSDDWESFKTTKETGTRIQFEKNGDDYADILIGKFAYIPQKVQNPYSRQPQGEMLTYVRVNDEVEVYAIEGSLGLGMGKTPDDFRNKQLLHLDKKAVQEFRFDYADGEKFSLKRGENNHWLFDDGTQPDSATMAKYLNKIRYVNGKTLAEKVPEGKPVNARLTVISDTEDTVRLAVYSIDTTSRLIWSSYNPTNPVKDEDNKITERVFVSRDYFKGSK